MGKTKRVERTGRFGARYGVGIRKRLLKVEGKQKKYYPCPRCGYEKAKRTAAGLYSCRKCSATFAGGAYLPVTPIGSIVQKMVSQRSFLPKAKELLLATEHPAEAGAEPAEAKKAGATAKEEKKERAEKKEEKRSGKKAKKKAAKPAGNEKKINSKKKKGFLKI